jgi:hypothetical protein
MPSNTYYSAYDAFSGMSPGVVQEPSSSTTSQIDIVRKSYKEVVVAIGYKAGW